MSRQQWQVVDGQLKATFRFVDFIQAFAFMTEVAFHAEQQGHHPTWQNTYNVVTIALCTHDAGNLVTEKDHYLADTIDCIYEKFS
jgi:4a-hydroxytetrahydrobiopterin dehydratase